MMVEIWFEIWSKRNLYLSLQPYFKCELSLKRLRLLQMGTNRKDYCQWTKDNMNTEYMTQKMEEQEITSKKKANNQRGLR